MRKIVLLLILTLLTTPAWADQTYTDDNLGFKLQYPADWTTPRQRFAHFLALYSDSVVDKNTEHFRVDVLELSGNGGASMIANMDRMQIERKFPELNLSKSRAVKLGNLKDAHRFDFTGKHNGQDFHLVRIIGFEGERAFKVTLGATEKNFKRQSYKFEKILRSFKVQ